MMIDSTTKLYGLLGYPVAGSRSPWIHNHVFKTCGIPAVYLAFPVEPEVLESAVTGLKALGIRGVNVTIPYKSSIIPMLEKVDPMAKALGAVNTLLWEEGSWVGYNTDGTGLLSVLKSHIPTLEHQRVLILGAGGAARGICGALIQGGIRSLGVWNRTPDKAELLVQDIRPLTAENQGITPVIGEGDFKDFDLVINTTSVGMEPETDAVPARVSSFKAGAVVCDIVYKPHQTRFLQEVAAEGHPVIHGIEMLIEQALLAQKLWNNLDDEILASIRSALVAEFEALNK